jgi:cell division protein FtsI (penicillin-binding protein 3)
MSGFSHKFRAFVVAILLVGGFGALVIRLFFLQVVWHDFFLEKASRQQRFSLTLSPKRGKILDRKGRDLAMSVPTKSFYAVPTEIVDPKKAASQIAKICSINESETLKRLSQKRSFVWIKRRVSESEATALLKLKLKGVAFLEEPKRVYPGGHLLSHVLGFTNLDEQGLEGLELSFDKYLKGKPGWKLTERDATGREILTPRRYEVEPRDGMNVVLTIDAAIQTLAESQLDEIMEKFEPESATILVMDPSSGEILALANRPSFDLNQASQFSPEIRRNRAVTDFFEPGSTLKPFIASAALEEKTVRLNDKFYCEEGSFSISGRHVLHDAHPYGSLSVSEIVSKSSNIGMAKIGFSLGSQRLFQYVKKFGFGEKTGVELPGEISGWVHPLSRWSKLTPYMISMGQEVTVTAMQITRAYCALANGGKLVKPCLVKQIIDTDGRVIFDAKLSSPERNVVSKETADQIIQAMKGVVTDGTGSNAQVDGYAVAGKTGTAQKAAPGGGYSHSKFVSSFIGFLPADHPQTVISVVVDEPKHFHYGGTVAAPAFRQLAGALMRYLEVPPDRMYAKKSFEEE